MPSSTELRLMAQARRRRAEAEQAPAEEPSLAPWKVARGGAEMALNMATGTVASGIAEAAAFAKGFVSEDTPENRARVQEIAAGAEEFTYQPRSPEAKAMQEGISKLVTTLGIDKAMQWIVGANDPNDIQSLTGEHFTKMMLAAAPAAALRRTPAATPGPGKTTPAKVRAAGIDVDKPGEDIAEQLGGIAETQRAGSIGQSMPAIKAGLEQAADIHRTRTRALYAKADDIGGTLSTPPTRALKSATESVVDEFNVYDSTGALITGMSAVDKRLADFRATFQQNAQIKISDIESYRQRLLRDARRSTNEQESTALQYMRKQLDDWELNEFTKVVRANSRETFDAYLAARDSSREYIKKFTEDDVINKLLTRDNVTVEEMRGWVMGAQMNALPHAGKVVERLNAIFGPDSRQMTALRQDYLYHVVEPLINNTSLKSGVTAFVRNYERTIAKSPTFIEKLAPYSKTHIEQAYKVARSLVDLDLTETQLMNRLDPIKIGARVLFGNKLAKGQARLQFFETIMRGIINTARPNRSRLYQDLFGYDPKSEFAKMSTTRGVVGGGAAAAMGLPEDEAE